MDVLICGGRLASFLCAVGSTAPVEMAPRTEGSGPSKIMKNRLGDQKYSKEAFGCHLDTILV